MMIFRTTVICILRGLCLVCLVMSSTVVVISVITDTKDF